ncbi:MAG: MFS transporter [Bdellovibrionales bacterium]
MRLSARKPAPKGLIASIPREIFSLPVIVCALGYFVDVYDIVIFSAVRGTSLSAIGIPKEEIFKTGAWLLNAQMVGMLLGGLLWGIVGDKKSRTTALFGSIFLYSVANILNAWVQTVDQYACLRFLSGLGLAGEIGGGVTLISEILPKRIRIYGVAVFGAIGLSGGVASGLAAEFLDWKTAYIIGGVLGLSLLALRWRVFDSDMFKKSLADRSVKRGKLRMLLWPPRRAMTYLACILIGIPVYFVVVVFMVFAPELAKSLEIDGTLSAAIVVVCMYAGIPLGDIACAILSQKLKSRRRALLVFLALHFSVTCLYLFSPKGMPVNWYYALSVLIGFCGGYSIMLVGLSAEHFGTNLRATVSTSVLNFVRASTIPITGLCMLLKPHMPLNQAALIIAFLAYALALIGLWIVEETAERDLDYYEK